eukprot:8866044-Pyramimonas_sp.AAC.1
MRLDAGPGFRHADGGVQPTPSALTALEAPTCAALALFLPPSSLSPLLFCVPDPQFASLRPPATLPLIGPKWPPKGIAYGAC